MRSSQTQSLRIKSLLNSSTVARFARGTSVGLLAVTMTGLVGCKSMPFSIPKPSMPDLSFAKPSMPKFAKPDMGKLAFWKSENLMAKKGGLPKPPSLSFDPSPIQNTLAATEQSARSSIEDARGQVANRMDSLRKPLREPYTGAKSAVEKLAESDTFDLNSGSLKAKATDFAAGETAKLTKAQRDFQAALSSSTAAIEKSIGGTTAQLASKTKTPSNDFSLPGKLSNKLGSAKSNVDQSLMAVNKSLYDSQGKLASKAKSAANSFGASATTAAKSQVSLFEQRLKQATAKPAAAIKPLQTAVASAVAPKAVASEVEQLKAQLAELKAQQQTLLDQQKAQLSATANQAAPTLNASLAAASTTAAPNAFANNSLSGTASTAAASAPSSPVAQTASATQAVAIPNATEFVANLTARPGNSGFAPSNNFRTATTAAPTQPTYPQMYPSTAPLRTANASNNVLASTPQNVLRGNFSPVRGQQNYQPVQNAAPVSNSPYPNTNHGGFAPQGNSSASVSSATNAYAATPIAQSTNASQASFQQSNDGNVNGPLVIRASTQAVENAASHVQDVNIPDAVLRGTSNYAPGSVHPLR